jgi:serine/threonine-protein kinase
VVHRDLKPENVVLVPMSDGGVCAKVVDFGVSKARGIPPITVEPALIGTPEFMAPEQAQGQSELIDHRTDQFALGILAYFLFTGREPFRGASPVAVLYQVVHEEAPALRSFVTWPSRRVDAVVRRAMAKNPERRFPTIQEFGRALEEAVILDLGLDGSERLSTPVPPRFVEAAPANAAAERRTSRKRRRRAEVDPEEPTVFRPMRRPWRMALFFVAAAFTAVLWLCMSSERGLAEPTRSATLAYRRIAGGAARIVARVRSGGPLAISTSAATAAGQTH